MATLKLNDVTTMTESGGTVTIAGSGVIFPAGHLLQVVQARAITTATNDTITYEPTPVTDNITITSGNDILVTTSIPFRINADATTDWMIARFRIYHSTDGSSYSDLSGYGSDHYMDQSGNLPNDEWVSGTSYITYLHESVSGTSHYYKVYFNSAANGETVSVSTSGAYWTMTLMEIQS